MGGVQPEHRDFNDKIATYDRLPSFGYDEEMRGKSCLAGAIVAVAMGAAMTVPQRLAQWKPVEMPLTAGLSTTERQMVDKLVEACRLLDDVFWRQSDLAGLALYKSTADMNLKRLLMIMGSRWDLIDENRPFTGSEPMPPGHELYPKGLTRADIEKYVQ